jgi:hypothetical protein
MSVVHRRQVDGQMFSMHQSGTHWLRNMMIHVICAEYDVPVPKTISDTSVIGNPRNPTQYEHIPKIVASHNITSVLTASWLVRALVTLPPRLILVRDIRSTLVSHYEKWKDTYAVSFSEYLRGDPNDKRFDFDIWWDIRFCNAWGRMLKRYPDTTHVVHYEKLMSDTTSELERCCRFFGIRYKGSSALEHAIAACSKDAMEKRQSVETGQVVRRENRSAFEWYNDEDKDFLMQTCSSYLKHNFGYDYNDWSQDV